MSWGRAFTLRAKRIDERVLGPAPLLTAEQAEQERELFKLDLHSAYFGLGLLAVGTVVLAVFADPYFLGVVPIAAAAWYLAFLAYQLARRTPWPIAARRALVYAFGWVDWL